MRRLFSIGLAASVLALTATAPALANPPDLMLKQGNGGGPIGPGHFRGGGGGGGGFNRGGGFHGGNGGFRQGGGFRQYGDRGGYRHGGYGGAAVGAGIAGLAAGALIGGAVATQGYYGGNGYGYGGGYGYQPAPVYQTEEVEAAPVGGDEEAYCANRYRSYDPESGTYLGFDGARHPCP